ncbi:MAG: guanylate kinase [Cryomorphaceae bacterium]|nr:guanylate kinase [Cryomorphaceae bacterium]
MRDTGKLLIFSAPSGAGKTTLVRHLLETRKDLTFSISATTRSPRGEEKDGEDYYFLTQKAFEARIANGDFVEYEEVYPGTFYGTLKSEVERIFRAGKNIVFDIDVQGGVRLKNLFGSRALAVFVRAPSLEVLEQRLRSRSTDSEQKIVERVGKAKAEMKMAEHFDVVIVNDQLHTSLTEVERIAADFLDR